jgi:hypothetical protein
VTYTLNHYNYSDHAKLLLPRAISYSAGLIDYFFRGKMDIALPDAGVYGIVDHSEFGQAPATPTAEVMGYRGFPKIKLKLKNSTDAITPQGGAAIDQPMAKGILVAVMKFRRNSCYRDDLQGEITDPAQAPDCRSIYEETVVSEPLRDQAIPVGTADSPDGVEFVFEFNDRQLPINAWDVSLQVVYRGQLGSEADAVVIVTKDISEPTFVTTHNDTDYVYIAGSCYTATEVAARNDLWSQVSAACKREDAPRGLNSVCANRPLDMRQSYGKAASTVIVSTSWDGQSDGRLPARRFSRVAILGESAAPLQFAFAFNNPPLHLPDGDSQDESLPPYTAEDQTHLAGTYTLHRGVKLWDGNAVMVDATAATTAPPCPDAQLGALDGPERYPFPVRITGW